MALISVRNLEFSVGGPYPLLERIDLSIEANERVCLVGRNGVGKSTLLKLLAGELLPDDGRVQKDSATVVTRLAQEVPPGTHGSVFDVVAEPLGDMGALLAEYHRLAERLDEPGGAERLGEIQAQIDAGRGWDIERRVGEILTRLELPGDTDFDSLSGGLKRRVLLGRALVLEPGVLLLDEPTNHLDIDAIDWLERFLKALSASIVFITHDRRFLRALATRIVELDRGDLTSWPGDYDNYLRRRAERVHAEEQERGRFDRRLAQEESWIRQGIKARRTRNEGRVRALQAMRRARAERRDHQGNARMRAAEADRSGRRVVEAENIDFGYAGEPLVAGFTTTILRGDRVGLVGPNGAGKTTLLRLLLGQLAPTGGKVKLGTNLRVAYFDQQRSQLDDGATAAENVAGGREFIEHGGRRRHIMGYLQDFLFTPERARAPITRLSGGERNRLLLAKLFAEPANVLVMDEPTNDLDIETLELLEELLANYRGTLLLVSHDRQFLDNVVTSTLILHGRGHIEESIGGYADWLARQRPTRSGSAARHDAPAVGAPIARTLPTRKKLSYREREELDALPERIEGLERRIAELTGELGDPRLYQRRDADIAAVNRRLAAAQEELEAAYARWAALDEQSTAR